MSVCSSDRQDLLNTAEQIESQILLDVSTCSAVLDSYFLVTIFLRFGVCIQCATAEVDVRRY